MFWHASDIAFDLAALGRPDDTVAVALLHDVLEDTDTTPQELFDRLAPASLDAKRIIQNVVALTRRQGRETYAEYIRRVHSSSDIATEVKVADLRHHLSTRERIPASLADRYTTALGVLENSG